MDDGYRDSRRDYENRARACVWDLGPIHGGGLAGSGAGILPLAQQGSDVR